MTDGGNTGVLSKKNTSGKWHKSKYECSVRSDPPAERSTKTKTVEFGWGGMKSSGDFTKHQRNVKSLRH